jgi:hypothetical protein
MDGNKLDVGLFFCWDPYADTHEIIGEKSGLRGGIRFIGFPAAAEDVD